MINFLFNKKSKLRINIASIFRNNEDYLNNHYLPNMEVLEKRGVNLHFFFYTDGNFDNTEKVLKNFCKKKRNAYLKTGGNKSEVFPRNTSFERVQNIVNARNQLLKLRPFINEYTVFIDSDIYFDIKVIERLVNKIKPNYCALFSNGIDQNYLKETNKNHYYDVLAFIDTYHNYGYEKFIEYGHKENPFIEEKDKNLWGEGKITNVYSAFGGVGVYRTEIINAFGQYDCKSTCKTLKNNLKVYADHWSLNFFANQFGILGVDPLAIVYHHSS